ncbi:MAG: hypothetical protein ACPGVD_03555 [Flavobacteriales bacterium]
MLKLYVGLTYVFNTFLAIGIFFSIYEFVSGGYSDQWFSFLISLISFYIIISSLYFINKSSKTSVKTNSNDILDNEINLESKKFRFIFPLAISNIIIGAFLIGISIFVLIFYPIFSFEDIEEILRFILLLLAIFYGFLKINYTNYYLKLIREND